MVSGRAFREGAVTGHATTGLYAGGTPMEWYRQVQFVSAVAMPPENATAFGTTVKACGPTPRK